MWKLAIVLFFSAVGLVSPRTWEDCIDPIALENDGAPRVVLLQQDSDVGTKLENLAKDVEIIMHGHPTTLLEEVDPYRVTSAPSSAPSAAPSSEPSSSPTVYPSASPSISPTISSAPSTLTPTKHPTMQPTFSVAKVPVNPKPGYFNYDMSSDYGPRFWRNIEIDQARPGFFHEEFDFRSGSRVSNDCGSDAQSPIDLCTRPRRSCKETHEMRPKPGDYKMSGNLIEKQILPSMLRLVMEPRTGEEPDPPQVDFSSNGRGLSDMTNIDFKFPSEHTICGHRLDGEMQYYTFHPIRKDFVAVAFLLDATEGNPRNNHLQEVIDAFAVEFVKNKKKCEDKQQGLAMAGNFVNGRRELDAINSTAIDREFYELFHSENEIFNANTTQYRTSRRLASSWHPFDPDVQKSVHFWGYSGSLTEPPCTKNSVKWNIIDVPTPISPKQLQQFKHLLFNHVDGNCKRTSVHNSDGSVARPTQSTLRYYKCTRDDYVSDEERLVCGDLGCVIPFGAGLNPYYPPLVRVTGPPTRAPSK